VTLLLPRAAESPRSDRPQMVERRAQSRLPVLVADDDSDVLQVTADMLRQLGYGVTMAQGGQQALALLDEQPAIVILDYAMPAMSGLEVAAAMRARGFEGSIILATGYAELGEECELSGLQGVLHKPYTISDLEALLAEVEAAASLQPAT
jgi:CheY-like chemotaxis protein